MREHTGLFFWITYLEQGYLFLAWNMLLKHPLCVSLKSPILPARILWQFLQISMVQTLYLEFWFCVALRRALLEIYVFNELLWNFLGDHGFRHRVRHCVCAGAHIFRHSLCRKWSQLALCGRFGEKLTVLGDNSD